MPLAEVRRGLGAGFGSNSSPPMRMTTMGELVTVDFLTAALLDGRGYQVRAGTIVTGLAAQDVIGDTVADMCADALARIVTEVEDGRNGPATTEVHHGDPPGPG